MSRSSQPPRGPFVRPGACPTNQSLSPEQQRLLALLQRIRFGRIHRLVVRDGQPVVSHLRWKRTVKVPAGENRPHPAAHCSEFSLKQEVREFFAQLADLKNGEITDL